MIGGKNIYNESKLDEVFLSYDKILFRLNIKNIKTKDNKDITHKDLRKAITVMQRKHKKCRWKSEKIRSRNSYILIEGYYWLINVYFNSNKKLIDADIEFFKELINQYEDLLKLESKNLFEEDIKQQDLSSFFNRKIETIEKAIYKMIKIDIDFRYVKDNEYVITKERRKSIKVIVSDEERSLIEAKANFYGYKTIASYIRDSAIYEKVTHVDLKSKNELYEAYSNNTKELKKIAKEFRHFSKYATQIKGFTRYFYNNVCNTKKAKANVTTY